MRASMLSIPHFSFWSGRLTCAAVDPGTTTPPSMVEPIAAVPTVEEAGVEPRMLPVSGLFDDPGASPVVDEPVAGTLLPDGTEPVDDGPAHKSAQVSSPLQSKHHCNSFASSLHLLISMP